MEIAGMACAVGVDGWRLLTTGDPVEAAMLKALTVNAVKAQQRLRGEEVPDG